MPVPSKQNAPALVQPREVTRADQGSGPGWKSTTKRGSASAAIATAGAAAGAGQVQVTAPVLPMRQAVRYSVVPAANPGKEKPVFASGR